MKWMVPLFCLSAVADASFTGSRLRQHPWAGPAPAPAPAPAPDAAGPAPSFVLKETPVPLTLETLRIKFEIKNFNYYDLTKQTCPEQVTKTVWEHIEPVIAPNVIKEALSEKKQPVERNPILRGANAIRSGGDRIRSGGDRARTRAREGGDRIRNGGDRIRTRAREGGDRIKSGGDRIRTRAREGGDRIRSGGERIRTAAGEGFAVPGKLPWMVKDEQQKAVPTEEPKPQHHDLKGAQDEIHDNSGAITQEIGKEMGHFGEQEKHGKPPWMKKKEREQQATPSLLQVGSCNLPLDLGETSSTECSTIVEVLRSTVEKTVRGVIKCLYDQSMAGGYAPGPAAPMVAFPLPPPLPPAGVSPGAFLQSQAPAPAAAAPMSAPSGPPQMPDMQIHVTFAPGRKMAAGRASTIVEVTFTDTPNNGVDDVKSAEPLLYWCVNSHILKHQMVHALSDVTHVSPVVRKVEIAKTIIEQWDINKCEKHMKGIVDVFSHHYTRRQVPVALYNECTNFMTRMSWSHDYVLDPQDTVRCRQATRKFSTRWNDGNSAQIKDFEEMCFQACEAKYGRDAPKCNIHEGAALAMQPL